MKPFKILLTIGLLLFSVISIAQGSQNTINVNDSSSINTIPLEEVLIVSIETTVRLEKLAESLITKDQLAKEKAQNDSLINIVNDLLIKEKPENLDSLLSRNLVNKKNFWVDYKKTLKEQETRVANIIYELSSKSKLANYELELWKRTKIAIDSTYKDVLFRSAINKVIFKADSVRRTILNKSKTAFSLLREVKQYESRIDEFLLEIESINKINQEQVFIKTQPFLLSSKSLYYSSWDLKKNIKQFIYENKVILTHFYYNNTVRFVFFVGYVILLGAVFFFLEKKSLEIVPEEKSIYQDAVIIMLHKPISLTIIIGIFSSGIFFPNYSPIIIDISIFVLATAIVNIIAHVSDTKGYIYLSVFIVLILLRFISYIFPNVGSIHRFILLIIGILEVLTLSSLLRSFDIKEITSHTFNQFARLIILFHLFTSIIGIITTITGHLRLAKITLELSITNTLVILLITISSVILIGLIQLAIDGKRLSKLKFLQNRKAFFKKRAAIVVIFAASLLWIHDLLQIINISDIFYGYISTILNHEISLGSISFTMGGVFLFLFIIWLSVNISDLTRIILEDDVLTKVSLKKGVPRMISVIIRFCLISTGIFIAINAIGMPLNQLTIIFSAFSVGIGFGLQNIVNNFVSGVILLFERPVQLGDTVEIGNLIGTVKSMGIRSSNVMTFEGAEVIVPNANLISNEVINWTLSDKTRRIEIISGVAYGSDVYQVQKILLQILSEHPNILKEPKPLVLFNDLGESSLDFRLLFWADNFDNWLIIKSEVVFKIHDALNKAGINIPFPQRDLHIKSRDKEE